jgi:hypothetical protein
MWKGGFDAAQYKRDYRKKYPHKNAAHSAVNNAKRRGKLYPKPCEICGSIKSEAHHDDYMKKLEVRWLCSTHHHSIHA